MIEKMAKARKKHNWMAGFTVTAPPLTETDRYIAETRRDRIDNVRAGKNPKTFRNY